MSFVGFDMVRLFIPILKSWFGHSFSEPLYLLFQLFFPHFEALKPPTKLATMVGPSTQKQAFLEPVFSQHHGAATPALDHLHKDF